MYPYVLNRAFEAQNRIKDWSQISAISDPNREPCICQLFAIYLTATLLAPRQARCKTASWFLAQ